MVRKILTGAMFWFIVLGSALYWIASWATPDSSNLEFEHIVRTSAALAVVLGYSSIFFEALLAKRPDRVQQLSTGIVLSWGSTVMMSVWSLLYRYGGRPPWMLEANIYGYFVFMQLLGAVLHITAPGAAGGGIPKKNWVSLGVAVGLASFIALVTLVYDPNVHGLVDMMSHYFNSFPEPRQGPHQPPRQPTFLVPGFPGFPALPGSPGTGQ